MTSIFVGGTSSHAGKSLLVAALCRIFSKKGLAVAPFKAQNMSLNSFITKEGKEIAIAQAFQAEACGIEADERMNPVLLKPKGNFVSQLIVLGEVVKDISSREYYKGVERLKREVGRAFRSLEEEFDLIVIEGAGGMAEINLYDRDIANLWTVRMAGSDVYLIGDIDRGGVFSSIYGTISLLPADVSAKVKGFVINKLRGDEEILRSGIEQLERLTGVKCLGILPYVEFPLPSEDSLSIDDWGEGGLIGVLKLPRISNFTDFEPLRGVGVRFVDLKDDLTDLEVVILPGTKDTISDLMAVKRAGMDEKIKHFSRDKPVIGVCGGYQILGKELIDRGVEHGFLNAKGLGLLDITTVFSEFKKRTVQTRKKVTGSAVIIDKLRGDYVWGYEIHKGVTKTSNPIFEDEGCANENGMVWGSYLHGLFWNENVLRAFCDYLGIKFKKPKSWIEKFSEIVENKVDVDLILKQLGLA